ncbi:MAG: type IV pilus modification PilV family protein [Planctomycetota bacterium]
MSESSEEAMMVGRFSMSLLGRSRKSGRRGFSFIEVLAAVALLVIGFMGMFASLHTSALLRETANETNVAMFKLQTTMEFLYGIPFDDVVTTLPEGTPIDLATLIDSEVNNDLTLNNEAITIAYEDPAADPLKFTISIAWTARAGNPRSANISSGRVR